MVEHAWGETILAEDGSKYKICKLCGMSDRYGHDKPCDGWPVCGTCLYMLNQVCRRYPPQLHFWDDPNDARIQIDCYYPHIGEDCPACGEHPHFKEVK